MDQPSLGSFLQHKEARKPVRDMFDRLIAFIHHFVQPSAAQLEEFVAHVTVQNHPKNQLLLRAGEVAEHVFFVNQGILRHFFVDGKNDGTVWFSFENDLVTDVGSFITRQPSIHNILTITEAEVLALRHADLQKLYAQHQVWERFGRLTTEQYLIGQIERGYSLLHKSATEKYEELLAHHPKIVQHVPLHQIASFIGVSFETLSRIRAKRA
jgi:CRP-like cAMP-binding protein